LALRGPRLSDLSDELLKHAMKFQVDRGRSTDTANKLYRTICAVWRHAWDQGLVVAPPRTKKYREAAREPQAWSLEEMLAIITAAEQLDGHVGAALAKVFFPAYCWCTYAIGSRQSVTLATPTANFDEQRGAILLPAELQKQHADQWMELIPEAAEAIARLQSRQRGLERLFGDWTFSITYFNKRLRRIIVAAGLRSTPQEVTRRDLSHKFRRTFATHACAASDEETVRQLLGHSHISVTRRYLDKRFLGGVSARQVVPPLRSRVADPPPPDDRPPLRASAASTTRRDFAARGRTRA
jgi:integrase